MLHPSLSFNDPIAETDEYVVLVAETDADYDQLYRLRYQIYNVEMQIGNPKAAEAQTDIDRYDAYSSHLLIKTKKEQQIIATYRMQTYEMATENGGFCGSNRYDFSKLPLDIQKQGLSVSRACIGAKYRNSRVFGILWKGLANVLYHNKLRYFFGCSTIPSSNMQDADDYIKLFQAMDVYHDSIHVPVLPDSKCIYEDRPVDINTVSLPAIFGLYLRFKCLVCSDPCFHKDFRGIEFLILHDTAQMSDRHYQMFFGDRKRLF